MPNYHRRGETNLAGGGGPVTLNGTTDAIIPVDNADSWIIGSDRMDRDTVDTTKSNRAFFNKVKGAFRVGTTTGTHWDDVNVGVGSYAEGASTIASGTYAHAEGNSTIASGPRSHAEGHGSQATGSRAHAEGYNTQATAQDSHAEGNTTTASGTNSHAENQATVASGHASHAEGYDTDATGSQSHAEGEGTLASGTDTHAEGQGSTASGHASHAEGAYSVASRHGQHAKSAGTFAAVGDAQVCNMVLRRSSTDATPALLNATMGVSAVLTGTGTNVLTIPTSRAYQLKISTVARRTDVQGEMAGFTWEGLVGRDSTGNARIIGAPIQAAWGDAPATDAWTVAVSVNTTDPTNNYVSVTATGETGKTIRWVAKMEWTEVGG